MVQCYSYCSSPWAANKRWGPWAVFHLGLLQECLTPLLASACFLPTSPSTRCLTGVCRLEEKEQQLAALQSQRANLADQVEVMQMQSGMGGAGGAGGAVAAVPAAVLMADLASLKLEGSDLEKFKALEGR